MGDLDIGNLSFDEIEDESNSISGDSTVDLGIENESFSEPEEEEIDEIQNGSSDEEELLPYEPRSTEVLFAYFDELSTSSISKAIMAQDVKKVKELLSNEKCLQSRDNNGYTPLHAAAVASNLEILDLLVKQPNIDLNATSHMGETPLLLSLKLKKPQNCILKLIEAGCDVNISNTEHETPLHLAARCGFLLVGQTLIEKGADIDAQDYNGFTALHEAVSESRLEFVQMLLYYGADATLRCECRLTPFMRSVNRCKDHRIAFELIEYEVDLNSTTSDGYNSLLLAINDFHPIAMSLVEWGADVNLVTPDNHNALELSLYWPEAKLFKAIWPKFNKNLLLEHTFLDTYLENCRFQNSEWVECFLLLLDSEVGTELVERFYKSESDVFESITAYFLLRNLKKPHRLTIIEKLLSLNSPVRLTNVATMRKYLGFNEEVQALLTADIPCSKPDCNSNIVTKLTVFLKEDANKCVVEYLYQHVYDFKDFLKGFYQGLAFVTPTVRMRRTYFRRLPRILKKIRRTRNSKLKRLNELILARLERTNAVPSLIELGRNASRTYIGIVCKGKGSAAYHIYLNNLLIPQKIKDIIKFKTPLYGAMEDPLVE